MDQLSTELKAAIEELKTVINKTYPGTMTASIGMSFQDNGVTTLSVQQPKVNFTLNWYGE